MRVDGIDEINSPATPSGDGWTFTLPDATTVELEMPTYLSFRTPPIEGCCELHLPRAVDEHREIQIRADDGLWLEVSEPDTAATAGFHAVRAAEPYAECQGASRARRFQIDFDFADEPAVQRQTVTGEVDGNAVGGLVTKDFVTNEEVPQAVVGRTE